MQKFINHNGRIFGSIHVENLVPFFDKARNYRTDEEYDQDKLDFVPELAWDGEVKDAVKIACDVKLADLSKAKTDEEVLALLTEAKIVDEVSKTELGTEGLRGNRRVHGFHEVFTHPDKYIRDPEKVFNPYIPVELIPNLSAADRIEERQDHDQARPLSIYGLGLSIEQAWRSYVRKPEKDIIWDHKRQLAQTTSSKQRAAYELALKERAVPMKPGAKEVSEEADLAIRKEITHKFFKGAYQRLHRIFCGPNSDILKANFHREVFGSTDGEIAIPVSAAVLSKAIPCTDEKTGEVLVDSETKQPITKSFYNLPRHDFLRVWGEMKEKALSKVDGTKKVSTRWTQTDYEKHLPGFDPCARAKTLIRGTNGEVEYQEQMARVRDELILIQKAENLPIEHFKKALEDSKVTTFWGLIRAVVKS